MKFTEEEIITIFIEMKRAIEFYDKEIEKTSTSKKQLLGYKEKCENIIKKYK